MEAEHHGPLKRGSIIFKSKGHNSIRKHAPGGCESSLVLVLFPDLNLVITEKTIHERKDFVVSTGINDLVNEWSGEVFFRTCQIQVMKVNIDMNYPLFFVNKNMSGNPSSIRDRVYENFFTQFLDLGFDSRIL